MKKLLILGLVVLGVLLGGRAWGQTNPTAQTLPYSQSFGTTTFTSMPTGMASWNGLDGDDVSTQTLAESSVPVSNAALSAATATTTTGGTFGYSTSSNGRPYIQHSGNATNGANQLALAIVTTGKQDITLVYDVEIISAQPRTVGIVMQYRVGTSGAWTTVAGTGNPYSQAGGTTGVKASPSIVLPAAANNQPVVQIRWATWRGTEGGASSGIAIDNISVIGTTITSCSTPTTQASSFTTSNIQETSMTVGFTRGNGNSVLVVAKQGSAVDQDPVDDVLYTANSNFGSGDQIGTGSYVVYSGASNTFNLTGLVASTTYHFAVYERNVVGALICYNTAELAGSQTTSAALVCPNTQATFTAAANPTENTLDVSWTRGDGDFVVVVARSGSAVNSNPVNGNFSLYSANSIFGSGDQIGTGNYVVYDGTGTNVTVSGLSSSTTYHFAVYEYKINNTDDVCYLTPAATGNGTTSTPPSTVVIYEVYGGGGNSGATYCHDFVVLKNCTASDINVGGYSVQYASSTGAFSAIYQIPTNTIIAADQLLGVRFASSGTTGCSQSYPSYFSLFPDNTNMSGTNGKVGLANNNTAITSPTASNVVDYVGFGSATAFEGSSAAPAPSITTSVFRNTSGGCNDTNQNGNDFGTRTPLPIELMRFNATKQSNHTLLSFATASERNNARFEIERSADGRVFQVIGAVKGAGDAQTQNNYSFTDEHPLRGINYYRLRQVDFDGASTLSQVVSVTFGKTGNVVLYPTPASETMNVRFDEAFTTDANWQIVDLTGRILNEGIFAAEQTEFRIPVASLTQGAYILRVTANNEVVTQQFRKQ